MFYVSNWLKKKIGANVEGQKDFLFLTTNEESLIVIPYTILENKR